MSRSTPDGLEEAAVAKFYRDSGGIQLSVYGVDADDRTIELGSIRGDHITYRWTERSDCHGFLFAALDEEQNTEGDDGDDSDDQSVDVEPDKDDYFDRFLTLTAKHHFAVSVLLGNIVAAAAERLAHAKGQKRLGYSEYLELETCLRRTGTPQAQWQAYIDGPTNTARVQALEVEGRCIMAIANALALDVGTAVRVLDAYGAEVDEGEFPTSSFTRWYRDWLAAMEEAAE